MPRLTRENTELAREMSNHKGTLAFTVFAHRVFDLLRMFMKAPAAMTCPVQTAVKSSNVAAMTPENSGPTLVPMLAAVASSSVTWISP